MPIRTIVFVLANATVEEQRVIRATKMRYFFISLISSEYQEDAEVSMIGRFVPLRF